MGPSEFCGFSGHMTRLGRNVPEGLAEFPRLEAGTLPQSRHPEAFLSRTPRSVSSDRQRLRKPQRIAQQDSLSKAVDI